MSNDSTRLHIPLRIGLLILLFIAPAAGWPLAVAVIAGAFLANEGLRNPMFLWLTGLLVLTESVWGIDIGTLSLSFIISALLFQIVHRFVTSPPLRREAGWSVAAVARAIIVTGLIALAMIGASVVVQAWLYYRGDVVVLAAAAAYPLGATLVRITILAIFTIMVLHRADVPFRRRISFGN